MSHGPFTDCTTHRRSFVTWEVRGGTGILLVELRLSCMGALVLVWPGLIRSCCNNAEAFSSDEPSRPGFPVLREHSWSQMFTRCSV